MSEESPLPKVLTAAAIGAGLWLAFSEPDVQELQQRHARRSRGLSGTKELREYAKERGVALDLYGDKVWGLSRILVEKDRRERGVGSDVMREIVRQADVEGAIVTLTPATDFGGSSVKRLTEFYKRFGFVENKGRNKDFSISDRMYRRPAHGGLGRLPDRVTVVHAARALKRLKRKAKRCGITPALLREGMQVELEHRDVTGGALLKTAKIAAAHLCERTDYYKRLKKVEG